MSLNNPKTDLFLIHPDRDAGVVKDVGVLLSVDTGNARDSRTPLQVPSALILANPGPRAQKAHQLPEPTTATFSLPIFEATVKVRMESGDVDLTGAVLGKEADASERKALAGENLTKADVVDSRSKGIG